jgi:hypothetical protein
MATTQERESYVICCGAALMTIRRYVIAPTYWFRLYAELLSLCPRKEKVTKEKARPASGFRYAQLPSLRCCSEGRQDGPSMARHASFGIHAKRPSPQHLNLAS